MTWKPRNQEIIFILPKVGNTDPNSLPQQIQELIWKVSFQNQDFLESKTK